MEKEFIPYELALKLKELGFNKECFGYYTGDKKHLVLRPNISRKNTIDAQYTIAPLWQQAFDWFREKYKLKVGIGINNKNLYYTYKIVMFETTEEYYKECFKTHQEARQACLEKLIELCGTL